jgi:hypothetical protein
MVDSFSGGAIAQRSSSSGVSSGLAKWYGTDTWKSGNRKILLRVTPIVISPFRIHYTPR